MRSHPNASEFEHNLPKRHRSGKLWQIVFQVSTVIDIIVLAALLYTIINSLFNRFDNEMGVNWDFMIEAIGLHLGCVVFKFSPLVGLGH